MESFFFLRLCTFLRHLQHYSNRALKKHELRDVPSSSFHARLSLQQKNEVLTLGWALRGNATFGSIWKREGGYITQSLVSAFVLLLQKLLYTFLQAESLPFCHLIHVNPRQELCRHCWDPRTSRSQIPCKWIRDWHRNATLRADVSASKRILLNMCSWSMIIFCCCCG